MTMKNEQDYEQPAIPPMPPATGSAPSMLCRIFGHKWERKTKTDYWSDELRSRMRRTEWNNLSHCTRCGTQNPAYEQNDQAERQEERRQ